MTAVTISQADRDRLIALLGMLGSEHDGEAANAARMVVRFLKTREIVWADILIAPVKKISPDEIMNFAETFKKTPTANPTHTTVAIILWSRHQKWLTEAEKPFVKYMRTATAPSVGDMEKLYYIYLTIEKRKANG